MKYHEPEPIERDEARVELESQDRDRICEALVRLALHDPDWAFVEEQCLVRLESQDLYTYEASPRHASVTWHACTGSCIRTG